MWHILSQLSPLVIPTSVCHPQTPQTKLYSKNDILCHMTFLPPPTYTHHHTHPTLWFVSAFVRCLDYTIVSLITLKSIVLHEFHAWTQPFRSFLFLLKYTIYALPIGKYKKTTPSGKWGGSHLNRELSDNCVTTKPKIEINVAIGQKPSSEQTSLYISMYSTQ